ncbi:Hypothetical predicted protein, partial [Drosophila guanche]
MSGATLSNVWCSLLAKEQKPNWDVEVEQPLDIPWRQPATDFLLDSNSPHDLQLMSLAAAQAQSSRSNRPKALPADVTETSVSLRIVRISVNLPPTPEPQLGAISHSHADSK